MAATRYNVVKVCGGIEPPTDFCTNNDGSTLPVIKIESLKL